MVSGLLKGIYSRARDSAKETKLLMPSSCFRFLVLILLASLALFLIGCGGSGPAKAVGDVVTVTLTPSPVSLEAGDVLQMTVSALDANKQSVFNQTFKFTSSNPAIQISNNGLLCGGTWDSLATPVNCKPANPGTAGIQTTLTARAEGVSSAGVTAFVHEQISSLTVTPANPPCVSQTGTVQYQAAAKDFNGNDITSSVGTFNWSVQPSTVGTAASFTTTGTSLNTVKAALPGIAQVNVSSNSLNSINSVPVNFQECPVTSIVISPTPVAFSGGGATQQMSAKVTDSLGVAVANQPLQWNASTPAVATINSSGLAKAVAAGATELTASCTPNGCNIGLNQPVYSNVVTATVPGTNSTTVYVTGTNTTSLVPISTATNTAGTAITLPQTPNSFVFSPAGDKAFLGSANGLMIFDPVASKVATITGTGGTVLAVSADGNDVLLTDGTPFVNGSGPTVGTILMIYDVKKNAVSVARNVPNAVSGDFTPDAAKAFAVSPTTLFIVQPPGTTAASAPLGSTLTSSIIGSQQVRVLNAGPVGYAAASGTPFFETCTPGTVSAGPGGTPDLVASLADGSAMIGAENANLDVISVSLGANGTCSPSVTNTLAQHAFPSSIVPQEIIVTPDSHHVYVTSNLAGQLLHYDIGAAAVTPVGLVNGATTFTGAATPDSLSVYVGGSDNTVHRIDVASESDANQIAVGFTPDLVAVRP